MRTRHLFLILICLSAVSLLAMPPNATATYYFDASGNIIGQQNVYCSPGHDTSTGDTSGDIYKTVIGIRCGMLEPFTCSDLGLTSVDSSCATSQSFCVTSGYQMSYMDDDVSDCTGTCLNGETGVCNHNGPCIPDYNQYPDGHDPNCRIKTMMPRRQNLPLEALLRTVLETMPALH